MTLKEHEEELEVYQEGGGDGYKAAVARLKKLYGVPLCKNLHHSKKNQHDIYTECPVVKEIQNIYASTQKM